MKAGAPVLPAAHERLAAVRAASRARVARRRRTRRTRGAAQHDAAAEARAAGDAAPLPPALHEAGARRVPRPPGSRAPPAAHLPARRLRAVLLGGLPPEARAVVTAPRWGSASRRWASSSTSRWSTTSRPTSCCAGWRASRWTASSSSRRRASDRRIARSAASSPRRSTRRGCPTTSTSRPRSRAPAAAIRCPCCARPRRRSARMIDVRKTLLGAAPWDDGDARRRLDWDGGQTVSVPDRRRPAGQRAARRGARRRCSARTSRAGRTSRGSASGRHAPGPRAQAPRRRSPAFRDRDRRPEQALRRHARRLGAQPARRGGRGDGVPRPERLGQDDDDPPADGPAPPQRRARGDPRAATATPTPWR